MAQLFKRTAQEILLIIGLLFNLAHICALQIAIEYHGSGLEDILIKLTLEIYIALRYKCQHAAGTAVGRQDGVASIITEIEYVGDGIFINGSGFCLLYLGDRLAASDRAAF